MAKKKTKTETPAELARKWLAAQRRRVEIAESLRVQLAKQTRTRVKIEQLEEALALLVDDCQIVIETSKRRRECVVVHDDGCIYETTIL